MEEDGRRRMGGAGQALFAIKNARETKGDSITMQGAGLSPLGSWFACPVAMPTPAGSSPPFSPASATRARSM